VQKAKGKKKAKARRAPLASELVSKATRRNPEEKMGPRSAAAVVVVVARRLSFF
jgi:hypothetical protein